MSGPIHPHSCLILMVLVKWIALRANSGNIYLFYKIYIPPIPTLVGQPPCLPLSQSWQESSRRKQTRWRLGMGAKLAACPHLCSLSNLPSFPEPPLVLPGRVSGWEASVCLEKERESWRPGYCPPPNCTAGPGSWGRWPTPIALILRQMPISPAPASQAMGSSGHLRCLFQSTGHPAAPAPLNSAPNATAQLDPP